MDLEGLTRWLPGRQSGYGALEAAVDRLGFYDAAGRGYRRWLPALKGRSRRSDRRWTSVRSGWIAAAICCSTTCPGGTAARLALRVLGGGPHLASIWRLGPPAGPPGGR